MFLNGDSDVVTIQTAAQESNVPLNIVNDHPIAQCFLHITIYADGKPSSICLFAFHDNASPLHRITLPRTLTFTMNNYGAIQLKTDRNQTLTPDSTELRRRDIPHFYMPDFDTESKKKSATDQKDRKQSTHDATADSESSQLTITLTSTSNSHDTLSQQTTSSTTSSEQITPVTPDKEHKRRFARKPSQEKFDGVLPGMIGD